MRMALSELSLRCKTRARAPKVLTAIATATALGTVLRRMTNRFAAAVTLIAQDLPSESSVKMTQFSQTESPLVEPNSSAT
jgi:hypothetical protein